MVRPERFTVLAPMRLGCVDLTTQAQAYVEESGIREGVFTAFCAHTTCSLLINEWEQGALEDVRLHIDELFPVDRYYAHDDLSRRTENLVPNERRNGHAHVAQMLAGHTSQLVPVSAGRLLLGRWQRLFLLELDDPKERTVVFHAFGQSSDQSRVTYSQNANPANLP